MGEQRLNFVSEIVVRAALGHEVGRALGGHETEGTVTELLDSPPAIGVPLSGRRGWHGSTSLRPNSEQFATLAPS